MEEWRMLSNGFYEASNLGRVRRAKPAKRTFVGKVLKQLQSGRYPHVILCFDAKIKKQCNVHRLIAEAFLGPCPDGMVVNHKDLNKSNASAENLEYVTPEENRAHAKTNGAYPSGDNHPSHRRKKA